MKFLKSIALFIIFACGIANAEPPPVQTPSSEEDIKAALIGGVPMGRWK